MMKKAIWAVLDAIFIVIGLIISVEFYFSLNVSQARIIQMSRTIPILLAATLISLWVSGIYKSLLRYAGSDTFFQAGIATLIGTGTTYLVGLLISLFAGKHEDAIGMRLVLMPRPIYFIQWVITFFLVAASRYLIRYKTAGSRRKEDKETKRILIIGAGYAGATVIRDIQNGRYGNAVAVAVLDDEPERRHSSISRVPVVGGTDEVKEIAEQLHADEIVIAIATPQNSLTTSATP